MPAAEFVSLAEIVRRGDRARRSEEDLRDVAAPAPLEPATDRGCDGDGDDAVHEAVRDARLFRARLADAFDDALHGLLREVAAGVLGRELRLAPCDLSALVARIARSAPFVRVRIAPADAGATYPLPAIVDASLDAGDAVLEVAGGALDVRLGVRLATVLEPFP